MAIARLPPSTTAPAWASGGVFSSITRTAEELSVICEERLVPKDVQAERGWRCVKLEGPFALTEVGIAADFTAALARSSVSVVIVSTFDTDYLLIAANALERALDALERAGHRVQR